MSRDGLIVSTAVMIAFFILFTILILPSPSSEPTNQTIESDIILEFYFSSGHCTACDAAKPIIDEIEEMYSNDISVVRYPVDQLENIDDFNKWKSYGFKTYPSVVIFNNTSSYKEFKELIVLLDTDESLEDERLGYRVEYLTKESLITEIEYQLSGDYSEPPDESSESIDHLDIPFFDSINPSDFSLPVLTIILGAVDSVNPCSFFVLMFLLSILLHTKERKKMTIIGGIFIFFSGFIYFLIMAVLIAFFIISDQQPLILFIAAIIALVFGILNMKDFFFFKKGPSASIPDSQKSELYQQMRHLVKITSVPSLIAATIIFAISANVVELFCSLQIPLLYNAQLLSYDLTGFEYYMYIFFYNVIYVIPLIIIVTIMIITLGRWKISETQGRVLKLFPGIMIFSLGELLLLNPDLLSNIFVAIGVLAYSLILTLVVYFISKLLDKDENKITRTF